MILGMVGIADVSRPAGSGRRAEAIVKQVFGVPEAQIKFSIIRLTPKHCRKISSSRYFFLVRNDVHC